MTDDADDKHQVYFLKHNAISDMKNSNNLTDNYQSLVTWYKYCARENKKSLGKLQQLLDSLHRAVNADNDYEKDVDDLESLKLIYETALRRHESLIDKYKARLAEMPGGL